MSGLYTLLLIITRFSVFLIFTAVSHVCQIISLSVLVYKMGTKAIYYIYKCLDMPVYEIDSFGLISQNSSSQGLTKPGMFFF